MTKTYTFTQPTTELEMYNLMNTFNAMRRSAKKTAIVEGLERMACTHRRIVVDGQVYFFNGQELTHFKGEHDCYLCHDNEIVSTPEQPRSYIIREEQVYAYSTEMHCLVWRPVFRVYDAQDGHPLYIGEYTVEAAEARLRRYHLVSTITVEYAHPASFNPEPFCQAVAMAVVAYIPPFEVCGSWEVDAHFQASRQLEAWQAEHPDVDIFPLIFGYFVDDGIEIEDFDLGEPGPREGEEEEDLHPTHGALPEWMYANEQEPYALSPAPMQHQHEHEQQPIIDTLRAMLAERRDKPAQDMLLRLVQEYEDEGAGNDGLLFAYIKEAAQTLYEVVERVKPEQ